MGSGIEDTQLYAGVMATFTSFAPCECIAAIKDD